MVLVWGRPWPIQFFSDTHNIYTIFQYNVTFSRYFLSIKLVKDVHNWLGPHLILCHSQVLVILDLTLATTLSVNYVN